MATIPDTRHIQFLRTVRAPRNALASLAPLKPKPKARKPAKAKSGG